MYFSVILVAAVLVRFAIALKHSSFLIKNVKAVPNGTLQKERIKCALALAQSNKTVAKISGGTDICDLLYAYQIESLEPEYEYVEKIVRLDRDTPPGNFKETVKHLVYSEVEIGDRFQFVFHKANTDRFSVRFKDSAKSTCTVLMFEDTSSKLLLKDGCNGTWDEVEEPQYPFSDFKDYKIVFEVLQLQWQIYIDDVTFSTFVHRRPFNNIKRIEVKVGPAVTYVRKTSDPRLPEL